MANRAQNPAKGLLTKNRYKLSAGGQIWAGDYSTSAKALDFDSTGLVLAGGVKVSNKQTLTADSTGIVFGNPVSSLPGSVDGGVQVAAGSNSTGVFLAINSTGTTWKYFNVTVNQPT